MNIYSYINLKGKRRWRYDFRLGGVRYAKRGFIKRAEAQDTMIQKREELKKPALIPTGMDFETLSNEYLDWSRLRHCNKTYQYKKMVYHAVICQLGNLPLTDILPSEILKYLRTRALQTSNNAFNADLKELNALFNWGIKHGLIDKNPAVYIEPLGCERQPCYIPPPEDFDRVLLVAGRSRAFLLVIYHTLARVGEILQLEWEDINFEQGWVRLWTRKKRHGERRCRYIPMNSILRNVLWGLWRNRDKHCPYVFVNPKTGTRYYSRPKLMRSLCQSAGVKHFGFHAIRHLVTSILIDQYKQSPRKLQAILGHESMRTTDVYSHVVRDELEGTMTYLEGGYGKERDNRSGTKTP